MRPALTLALAMLAAYALASALIAALVAVSVRLGLAREWRRPDELLALRLLPSAGALVIVFAALLPAFIAFEPLDEAETAGPVVTSLAIAAVALLGSGIVRCARAWLATRRLLVVAAARGQRVVDGGQRVDIFDDGPPLVAVAGTFRPRILASRGVLEACDAAEFAQVIAHERAHVAARDNLKLLLLIACPDPLAWLPLGTSLAGRWRLAAEYAADEHAAGAERGRRLDLASALIKVARLTSASPTQAAAIRLSIAEDDVEGRVRSLLAPPARVPRTRIGRRALLGAAAIAAGAVPMYALIHGSLEALIALGR